MAKRRKFKKRYMRSGSILAVQVDLELNEFTYNKWGATQTCKQGDWLVNNQGDVYTVDRETFEGTYRPVSPGVFTKAGNVWAERADADGSIRTQEGVTHFNVGDYLVFNDPDGCDGYCVSADKFEEMYEPEQ